MNTEIEKVKTDAVSDRDLQKLLNQIETQRVADNSSMLGIAENLAEYHLFHDDANLINTEIERYRKVTPADLTRVAKRYLRKDQRVVLHYLPNQEHTQEERGK